MAKEIQNPWQTAQAIAEQFSELAQVEAVALGGSLVTGQADGDSDIDLYVYAKDELPLEARAMLVAQRASQWQLDNRYWETEDYWLEKTSGSKVEVIYRNPDCLEQHLKALLEHSSSQQGYSTSLWHNIVNSKSLFDRKGWFASLQSLAKTPYPDALANAIISHNVPLLKGSMAAHPYQIRRAAERADWVCVNGRLQSLLASYFDSLFALNRELHPGEKRQLMYANKLKLTPEKMSEDVTRILTHYEPEMLADKVDRLVERLLELLAAAGVKGIP